MSAARPTITRPPPTLAGQLPRVSHVRRPGGRRRCCARPSSDSMMNVVSAISASDSTNTKVTKLDVPVQLTRAQAAAAPVGDAIGDQGVTPLELAGIVW